MPVKALSAHRVHTLLLRQGPVPAAFPATWAPSTPGHTASFASVLCLPHRRWCDRHRAACRTRTAEAGRHGCRHRRVLSREVTCEPPELLVALFSYKAQKRRSTCPNEGRASAWCLDLIEP